MQKQTQSDRRILSQALQERGWTLVELLVGMTMMLAIIFAAFPVIEGAARTEGRIETAALSVGDARVFADEMLRDLRPANEAVAWRADSLTVNTWVRHDCGGANPAAENDPPTECLVTYSCSPDPAAPPSPPRYHCQRRESDPNGGGPGPWVTKASGLMSPNIFDYVVTDVPVFVEVILRLPNEENIGGDAITLRDGTALRNL